MAAGSRWKAALQTLWENNAPLTFTAVLMLAAFAASLAGLAIDDRIITGSPAWLKPAKFGISTALYTATIAWLLGYIRVWRPAMRACGWIIAAVLILEVAIIDLQAARGTTSHFNISTPLDAALFGIMGVAIGILWLASVAILAALFRQSFSDRAWGWALRLGMLVTVLGAAAGGMMLGPTRQQQQETHRSVNGAHTVGGPDGGAGLPGTGWSTSHGDLRIPHFFGLHAIQIIPFLAFAARRRTVRHQGRFVATAAFSYLALIAILTWQALRGQSIVQTDSSTTLALALWVCMTGLALWLGQIGGKSHADGLRSRAI